MATDSEYVVSGATGWTRGWERNGWMTAKKIPVKSRDLWGASFEGDQKTC
jgi:ribonuclease HI